MSQRPDEVTQECGSSMGTKEESVQGIRPPKSLIITADMSTTWKQWKQQFEWYAKAVQLYKKPKDVQAATFMAIIGIEAIPIYNNFNLQKHEEDSIEILKERFSEYFNPKINVSYERYIFNKITQREEEPFDIFLTRIKTAATNCEFKMLHDELIKDKIVLGIREDKVREKLLTEDKLSLQGAIMICKASEQATIQLRHISSSDTSNVCAVQKKSYTTNAEFDCKRCGNRHAPASCPAFKNKCRNCGKTGHFQEKCFSKRNVIKKGRVRVIENDNNEEDNDEEVLYIHSVQRSNDDWNEIIKIGKIKFQIKLDTGAQCNVLPKYIIDKLQAKLITSRTKRLVSFTDDHVNVIGKVVLNCEIAGKSHSLQFNVVNEEVPPILGRYSCENLGLILRVKTITKNEYPEGIFDGLGCRKNYEYDIDLIENPVFKIQSARRIPLVLKDKVKAEIENMVKIGVIKPISEPTPVVSPLVIVKQKDKLRICIDPTDVNKNILRRHFPLKTIEEISTELTGFKYFTLLDCKKGFWQLKVSERTQKYLAFATPWGRYTFTRLPFGIASAPEIFQEMMSLLLNKEINVKVSMDDILIYGKTLEELRCTTLRIMNIINDAGLKLNKDKCVFEATKLKFLGHIVSEKGLEIDPEKVSAIQALKIPTSKKHLQRILGMINYLHKFIPHMSQLTEPLRELLKKNSIFQWNSNHTVALEKIKSVLSNAPTLKFYDVNLPVTISADASSTNLGAVLLQNNQPVAYATRALTQTEQNYPQIEKEALALKFACKKFHEYVFGKFVLIETDHKPLETIFKKGIYNAPPRLQRIMFEVMQYSPTIKYKEGKYLYIADTLSRDCDHMKDDIEEEQLEVMIAVPMTKSAREELIADTLNDSELQLLLKYILEGFPINIKDMPNTIKHYFNFKEELSYYEGIIFKGNKIVVPKKQISKMLKAIHMGHLGIQSCLRRARQVLYWRGQFNDIVQIVTSCETCERTQRSNTKSTVNLKAIPAFPWQIVASDLFEYKGNNYIVIVDSYSGFMDFKKIKFTLSKDIIECLKDWFAIHGIPEIFESDNGPQFSSYEFKVFSKEWQFNHQTSSPHHPQGNGLAERAVQIAKNILRKCAMDNTDVRLALLNLRNTPRDSNLGSPNQRLLSRTTRSTLPTTLDQLLPKIVRNVSENLLKCRSKQNMYANKHTKPPKEFTSGNKIRFKTGHRTWKSGEILNTEHPRSVTIKTNDGHTLRRNTEVVHDSKINIHDNHIIVPNVNPDRSGIITSTPSVAADTEPVNTNTCPEVSSNLSTTDLTNGSTVDNTVRTRSGRLIKPVVRLNL